MSKTRNNIDQMSTVDWQQNHSLLTNQQLMKHFDYEVYRFARCTMTPNDVLRRFSLNGDGYLDLREFQLAVIRLEIVDSSSQQTDGQPDEILERAKELYMVFCPTPTRKLDIDVFCRIMTEWSLQARYQHDSTPDAPSMSSLSTNGRSQYSHPRAPLATPYATQSTINTMRTVVGDTESNGRNQRFMEGETLWQRLRSSISQAHEKLQQIFVNMDVMCSGKISPEELELALGHIGVIFTSREYGKLYVSLGEDVKEYTRDGASNGRWHGRGGSGNAFSIKYTEFLAMFREKSKPDHRTVSLPPTPTSTSPRVVGVGSARLWDLLVVVFDNLQSLFHQYERIGEYFLPPETFRDCLLRCGITLSNADFAALRVRLLPFSDTTSGSICVGPLLDALKAADRTMMKSNAFLEESSGSNSHVNQNPMRLGRKTVPSTTYSPMPSEREPYPAGKSTQERNAETSRTIVKICDERHRASELYYPTTTSSPRAGTSGANERYREHQRRRHDPFSTTKENPPALEARILSKLHQFKQLGQIPASSPQSIFAGDRFGCISRGQFRQGLVYLNLLARYADVEALFWTLDTQGRGYIAARDLYDHLDRFAAKQTLESSKQSPNLFVDCLTKRTRLSRSVQKVLENLLVELPQVLTLCERIDKIQTGFISTTDMLQLIHELGILASLADKRAAVEALCRGDQFELEIPDQIPYPLLERRLGALCCDLLSPKKRSQHRSTTSILLAPFEEQAAEVVPVDNLDATWSCPRRRIVQDFPAARSSIQLTDEVLSPTNDKVNADFPHERSKAVRVEMSRQKQRRRISLIGILQDLLERRTDLKTALNLHRRVDARGHVTKQDLVEILLTSRLNLHFSAGASAAQELVEELYPSSDSKDGLGFLDVLRRVSDLLSEVTNELSMKPASSTKRLSSSFSTNPIHHSERLEGEKLNHSLDMHSSVLNPTMIGSFSKLAVSSNGEASVDCALTIRRKLLQESRLKNVLNSDYALQSAAVLIRHAFKGLGPREMVVPIDNGEFEATCRADDIKHVCFRLGLDLDLQEQRFVVSRIDTNESGFVSSPGLLDLFTKLTQTETCAASSKINREKQAEPDKRRSVTFNVDGD